jgi:hypothetical protein
VTNRRLLLGTLLGLGAAMEIIYLAAFLWPFPLWRYYRVDIDMAEIQGHRGAGFALFIGAFILLFVCLAIAWWCCRRLEVDGPEPHSRRALWLVLGMGGIYGITLSFVYPVTAIDVFSYVAQSRVLVYHHSNPIFVPPNHYPRDPLMALAGGWAGYGSPYGPLGILLDAVPSLLAGANLFVNLIMLKLGFSAMTVAEALVAYRIVGRTMPGWSLTAAMLVAWNPLILFETSANGHNDIAMILLASLGLLALVEGDSSIGIVLVAASILVKYATMPLLPLALIYVMSRPEPMVRRLKAAGWGIGLGCLVTALAYAPFWGGPSTLSRSLLENGFHLQSFGSVVAAQIPALSIDGSTLLGRLLFVPVYVYAGWLATKQPRDLQRASFLALFAFVGLAAANFKIWYAVWPLALAACAGAAQRAAALLMGLGASLSAALYAYVYIWLGQTGPAFDAVNSAAYLVTFVPAAAVLCLHGLLRARQAAEPRLAVGR